MSWAAFCVTHCCDCIFTILLQRRQSGLKSGDRGSGSTKISILPGKFSKHFDYFQSNFRNSSIFSGNFTKKFNFFRQSKKFRFSMQKLLIYRQLLLGKLFYFSSKVTTFDHTSCTRQDIIIFHDPSTTPYDPLPKIWGSRPQPSVLL